MAPHSNQYLLPHTLTDLQHQVLVGTLLGDAHLSLEGKYPRMKIDRQRRDKPYLEWQYNIFKDLCKSGIKEITRYDKRYDTFNEQVYFRTRAIPAFLDYHNKWYIDKIKSVPQELEFTTIVLATWFADDGCVSNEQNQNLRLKLSTDGFGYDETKFL